MHLIFLSMGENFRGMSLHLRNTRYDWSTFGLSPNRNKPCLKCQEMPSEVPWMQKMGWQAGLCSGPRWRDYSALISVTGGKGKELAAPPTLNQPKALCTQMSIIYKEPVGSEAQLAAQLYKHFL